MRFAVACIVVLVVVAQVSAIADLRIRKATLLRNRERARLQGRPSFKLPEHANARKTGAAKIKAFSDSKHEPNASPPSPTSTPNHVVFNAIDYETSSVFEVDLTADTLKWAESQENGPHEGQRAAPLLVMLEEAARAMEETEEETVFNQGANWTRITPITTFPQRVIGRTGAGCTGAMIRNRLVLTAAHCIYDHNTSSWNTAANIAFTPKHDRGATNTALASQTAFIVKAYLDAGSYAPAEDWGVIVLQTAANIGYMGTQANNPSTALTLDGYPQTKGGNQEMWEDSCTINQVGTTRWSNHRCDVEPGSSGGPMWDSSHRIHAVQSGENSANNVACLLNNADIGAIKGFIKTYG